MSAFSSPTFSRLIGSAPASILCGSLCLSTTAPAEVLHAGDAQATMTLQTDGDLRTYRLASTALLRDGLPPEKQITFSETAGDATLRTGSLLFDGLYAMAVAEVRANSVSQIKDQAYAQGAPVAIKAFQTGEKWTYVWTRDLSYALHLGLAGFDPARAVESLLFKASGLKGSAEPEQIVQDTGSGGSYPVSTDRVVWALGAHETLKHLSGAARDRFLGRVYPILCGTIEQDRRLVFDPADGLYRGEQSFLDWREQTYPGWTRENVLAIAMSKALSVNAANCLLLQCAAECAGRLGKPDAQRRYAGWAADLRDAVNRHFYEPSSGLYSAYLLSDDGSDSVRAPRYDLLGEALAILSGIADEERAASILRRYPCGAFGPPVVWPQERSVPIYHNQGIWPFVTAYWLKAARLAGNVAAVDAGIRSLREQAALNLSNMENFDFVSGRANVTSGPRLGPVINSRRQLWSVAGYLSMVQDIVFGLETSLEGIRFQPFITARLCRELFGERNVIEWRDFAFRGTQNRVRIHLPPLDSFAAGVCAVDRVTRDGQPAPLGMTPAESLRPTNDWDIYLRPPEGAPPSALHLVEAGDDAAIFAPAAPRWRAIPFTAQNGLLTLHFEHDDAANVRFQIYRDGELCARDLREMNWTDPQSADCRQTVRSYRVAAVDPRAGNVSHLTPARADRTSEQVIIVPASALVNRGGKLVEGHHFADWGKKEHEIATQPLRAPHSGRYALRVEFSNGAGPVNTGITCAVKKLAVSDAGSGEIVAAGYVIMPQSGDWNRYDLSSVVHANLQGGLDYILRLAEDATCQNMSYLASNERYTGAAGGGVESYNYANIAAFHLMYVAPLPPG